MNDVLLEMVKQFGENYEKIVVYLNGNVEMEVVKNKNIVKETKTITIVEELVKELNDSFDILMKMYGNDKNENFKVSFNNHEFYNYDFYLDINLMVKFNQFRKLSVHKKYKEEKKKNIIANQIEEKIKILDSYENMKNEIDISNISNTNFFNNERTIVQFELKENSSFKLGESRFFSDTIDIADDVEIPKGLEFVGQLNLAELAAYNNSNSLPKNGILYFFQSPVFVENHYYEHGKVIYSNYPNLTRKSIEITEDNQDIYVNFSLNNIKNNVENFNDRYRENKDYDSFKGEEVNKIFGFYTDCQMDEEDIIKVSQKYIVLLQLGTDIYGEGVITYLITEEDLKNKNFDNIIYTYVQS